MKPVTHHARGLRSNRPAEGAAVEVLRRAKGIHRNAAASAGSAQIARAEGQPPASVCSTGTAAPAPAAAPRQSVMV